MKFTVYTRISKDVLAVPGCARIYYDMKGYAKMCKDIPGYARICQDLLGCTRIRIFHDMFKDSFG